MPFFLKAPMLLEYVCTLCGFTNVAPVLDRKSSPNAGKIVGMQTTWMIQNMICRNHVAEYYSARNEDKIVCLAPGVLYQKMCQKDVKSLWFKSLV